MECVDQFSHIIKDSEIEDTHYNMSVYCWNSHAIFNFGYLLNHQTEKLMDTYCEMLHSVNLLTSAFSCFCVLNSNFYICQLNSQKRILLFQFEQQHPC